MNTETLYNGYVLRCPGDCFPLSTDSMVCADFARFPTGSRVADLGCGCGILSLLLLAKDPALQVTGIELEPSAAGAAAENALQCGGRFTVLQGDLRQIPELLPAGSMDGCISNPPYFPPNSGFRAQGVMGRARSEETLSLAQLTRAAGWLLRTGGRFALVHRAERLADVIFELRSHGLEPKRLQFVRHSPAAAVSLVLVEAVKGGKPGMDCLPELLLRDETGAETADCQRIYHRT